MGAVTAKRTDVITVRIIDKVIDRLVGKAVAKAAMCFNGHSDACPGTGDNERVCYNADWDEVLRYCI